MDKSTYESSYRLSFKTHVQYKEVRDRDLTEVFDISWWQKKI